MKPYCVHWMKAYIQHLFYNSSQQPEKTGLGIPSCT